MELRKRQLLATGLGLAAAAALPGPALASATAPLLVIIDIDTPSTRAVFKGFVTAVNRRFAGARIRPEVRFIANSSETDEPSFQSLKQELVAARADIILASNPTLAAMARKCGLGTPILFFSLADPIASGLTDSLTRPGMGMTGFTLGAASNLKRREMLLRLAPRCRRVGLLSGTIHLMEGLRQPPAGHSVWPPGIDERIFKCDRVEELAALVKTRGAREVDAWDIEYTFLAFRHPEETVRLLATLKRPIIYPRMKHVHLGGMAAYEPSIEESDEAWVSQVASLLAGIPIAEIPVVQATRYSFGLNLRTCRQVGIDPPKSLIKIADLVIE